ACGSKTKKASWKATGTLVVVGGVTDGSLRPSRSNLGAGSTIRLTVPGSRDVPHPTRPRMLKPNARSAPLSHSTTAPPYWRSRLFGALVVQYPPAPMRIVLSYTHPPYAPRSWLV